MGRCCTCNEVFSFKQLQAGHFEQGRHNAVLFDERNVHAQCAGCNIFKHGNLRKYEQFMRQRYGQEVIDELDTLDSSIKSWTVLELSQLATEVQSKLNKLENGVDII